MPVTQIPSRDPASPAAEPLEHRELSEAQHWETAYRRFNPDDVPHLLIQLQDDLSRARKREALWLSVILHLMFVILLWNSDKIAGLLPHRTVALAIRTDVDREKDATFLELPPDEQKLSRRPDAKVLSDKDRIATSKAPQINREELKKILQSAQPGQPGPPAQQPQGVSAPPELAQQAPPQPQQQSAAQQGSGLAAPEQKDQVAQLRTPPQSQQPAPNFNNARTPGSLIEQAAQAAAANRGRYGSGSGQGGDYGLSQGRNAKAALAPAEVLSDTMGVDFAPYITRMLHVVRENWIRQLPEAAFPPIRKQGITAVDFVILRDGRISEIAIHLTSGDVYLDEAAKGGISASSPLPPLPKEFPGLNIVMRITFFLNTDITDLR